MCVCGLLWCNCVGTPAARLVFDCTLALVPSCSMSEVTITGASSKSADRPSNDSLWLLTENVTVDRGAAATLQSDTVSILFRSINVPFPFVPALGDNDVWGTGGDENERWSTAFSKLQHLRLLDNVRLFRFQSYLLFGIFVVYVFSVVFC